MAGKASQLQDLGPDIQMGGPRASRHGRRRISLNRDCSKVVCSVEMEVRDTTASALTPVG